MWGGREGVTGPAVSVLTCCDVVTVELYVFTVCSVCYSPSADYVFSFYIF